MDMNSEKDTNALPGCSKPEPRASCARPSGFVQSSRRAGKAATLIAELAKDPIRLELAAKVFEDPIKAIDSLDLLIRNPGLSLASRKQYQALRNSLEAYMVEKEGKKA